MAGLRADIRNIDHNALAEVALHTNAIAVDGRERAVFRHALNGKRRDQTAAARGDVLQLSELQRRRQNNGRIDRATSGDAAVIAIVHQSRAATNDSLVAAGDIPSEAETRLRPNQRGVNAARRIALA